MIYFNKDVWDMLTQAHFSYYFKPDVSFITEFPEPYFWNQMQVAETNVLNTVYYVGFSPGKEYWSEDGLVCCSCQRHRTVVSATAW